MFKESGFLKPNNIDAISKVEKKKQKIEDLIPKQEDRNGLLVNVLENKKIKGEISPEQLSDFVRIMHDRIAQELQREKTTLPKDKLQQLNDELQANPQFIKGIIESFGFGVASDPFMLYGIIKKGKDLVRHTVKFYKVDMPSVRPGSPSLEEESNEELSNTLSEFWNFEAGGPDKGEFPIGDLIRYYDGKDALVEDESPRFGLKKGDSVPAFRCIFSSRRKNKTDDCTHIFGGDMSNERIKREGEREAYLYALQFRDNSDAMEDVKYGKKGLTAGYPAEYYISASSKKKVLDDYFQKVLIPEMKASEHRGGIY